MSIEHQAIQVRKVKRSQNGLILDPVTLSIDSTAGDAIKIMREYKIGGIPVVGEQGKLLGIITNRDLRFQKEMDVPVQEIMTKDDLITAIDEVSLDEAEEILKIHKIEKLPIVNE